MSSHLTGKRLKSSPVREPESDFFFFYPKYQNNSPARIKALLLRSPSGSRLQSPAAAPFPAGPVLAVRPTPAHRRVCSEAPSVPRPWAPRRRGASRLGTQPATQVGCWRAGQRGPARRPSCSRVQGHFAFPPKDKGQ